jgi:hypothetical protein
VESGAFDENAGLHPKHEKLDRETLLKIVNEKIGRKIIVIGATTGSDAHTVGIDAILNRKGYAGDFGLESYPCFEVINLRLARGRVFTVVEYHGSAPVCVLGSIAARQLFPYEDPLGQTIASDAYQWFVGRYGYP